MALKSFVLIERSGRFLLIREASPKWKGKWYLPGGSAKPNESPEATAVRETKEEAGCDVTLTGIFFLKYTDRFFSKKISVYYAGTITDDASIKQIADKHSLEVSWFSFHEIFDLPARQDLLEILGLYTDGKLISLKSFKLIK